MAYIYNDIEYNTLKEAKDNAYKDINATKIIFYLSARGICFNNVIEMFIENSANAKKFHGWMREQVGQAIEDYFEENILDKSES